MRIEFDFDDDAEYVQYIMVNTAEEAEEIESNAIDDCQIFYVVEIQERGDFACLAEEIEMPEAGIDECWERPRLMDWSCGHLFHYFNEDAFTVRDFLEENAYFDDVRVYAVIFKSQLDQDGLFGNA